MLERLNGHGNQYSPVDWVFQGSNDASNWVDIDSQSGHTTWTDSEIKEFPITVPTTTGLHTTSIIQRWFPNMYHITEKQALYFQRSIKLKGYAY